MNQFGGDWTKVKIEILVEYARAYLTIMNIHANRYGWKLLYFDGFAGSGEIIKVTDDKETGYYDVDVTIGAAKRIIEIEEPRPFDEYYFVEMDEKKFKKLEEGTKMSYPKKQIHVVKDDCNKKLIDLANFLRDIKHRNYKTLAFIDPCGMQVEWNSIECLRGLFLDIWILVPTGLGVNRLLKRNGQISDAWLERLEKFLGLSREEIEKYFYKRSHTLFPDIMETKKEQYAIEKSAKLYQNRLKEVFDYVSKPYELKNSTNSTMFHLYLASNKQAAINIANDIVKKYNR